mgnify:CR=1 FL=1
MKRLNLGCTALVHEAIGIHAVVNARGGQQHLNQPTQEDIELMRDGRKIKDKVQHRIVMRQVNSRFFRRHQHRIEHLLSDWDDAI